MRLLTANKGTFLDANYIIRANIHQNKQTGMDRAAAELISLL